MKCSSESGLDRVSVAQDVEEAEPEDGVTGLVATAVPDQCAHDEGKIHEARHLEILNEILSNPIS